MKLTIQMPALERTFFEYGVSKSVYEARELMRDELAWLTQHVGPESVDWEACHAPWDCIIYFRETMEEHAMMFLLNFDKWALLPKYKGSLTLEDEI